MARKLVQTLTSDCGRIEIKTYKDYEWEEFVNRVKKDGKWLSSDFDYHSDKDDCIKTAESEINAGCYL
jgi:hypothetical protein